MMITISVTILMLISMSLLNHSQLLSRLLLFLLSILVNCCYGRITHVGKTIINHPPAIAIFIGINHSQMGVL